MAKFKYGQVYKYMVSPLEAVVLMHNVTHSEDADCDADRTVTDLIKDLDTTDGYVSKGILESALFCCNIENEKGKFWHPLKYSFTAFVNELLPGGQEFHRYHNVIVKKEKKNGPNNPPGR